jgi:hypothetical protein
LSFSVSDGSLASAISVAAGNNNVLSSASVAVSASQQAIDDLISLL